MTDDLARSRRSTARGALFRRRMRLVPGDLRPASPQRAGIAAGMLTGALLGLAVLSAFALPFMRIGGEPVDTATRISAAEQPAAEIRPPVVATPGPAPSEPPARAAVALALEPLPVLTTDDPSVDGTETVRRTRQAPRRTAGERSARCGQGAAPPCPVGAVLAVKER